MLTHIFHVSDIHIRNGDRLMSRYDEYDTVFNNLFDSIKSEIKIRQFTYDQYVIILTGDIFHNKNIIGNYGLTLYKKLVENLTSIGRTIIFHGNHDRNQNEKDQPSLISSTITTSNLTILDRTQSFVIDKIGFSYVNIDDTLDELRTSGRIDLLPAFPEIQTSVDHKVALFHGTFANVKLNNDTVSPESSYPFEWIGSFDYALLGDIHLRQKGTYGKTLWGYSGSLVQQNYGEEIINHGYMVWDLYNRKVDEINVYNAKGQVYLKQQGSSVCIKIRSDYVPLEDVIKSQYFPKHVDVKLYSDIDTKVLLSLFKQFGITFNIVNRITDTTYNQQTDTSLTSLNVDQEAILEYFHNHLSDDQYNSLANMMRSPELILLDEKKYPDDMRDECKKKNKDLRTLVNQCLQGNSNKQTSAFKINYLEFSNLYCYEGNNWIDFTKAAHNIFLMAGNNGTGKSAIYDILVLAIWGNVTTHKRDTTLSGSIINYKHKSASTTVELQIGDTVYKIHRTYNVKNELQCNKNHIKLYEFKDSFDLIAKDNACNERIAALFGTLDEFLASSMVTQNVDADILRMNHKDCLALIDNIFNIDYLHNKFELFKTATKRYKDFKKIIESKKDVYDKLIISIDAINHSELSDLIIEKDLLEAENNSIAVDINDADAILSTDFNDIEKTIHIKSKDAYTLAIDKYNELKVCLKDLSQIEIQHLVHQYDPDIQMPEKIDKPCDYSMIEQEEKDLLQYKNIVQHNQVTLPRLDMLESAYQQVKAKLHNHNDHKPPTILPPKGTLKDVLKSISILYDVEENIAVMQQYCSKNNKIHTAPSSFVKVSYTAYRIALQTQKQLKIRELQSTLSSIDEKLSRAYNERNNLQVANKPALAIPMTTSKAIEKELKAYDYNDLQKQIQDYEVVLNHFYEKQDEIVALQKQMNEYQIEMQSLSADEYEHDPKCKYCCKRPWVLRKNELVILIQDLTIKISNIECSLYDQVQYDYLDTYIKCESNKALLEKCALFKQWLAYFHYKEESDHLSSIINGILNEKQNIADAIKKSETLLKETSDIIAAFNVQSFNLYDDYCQIIAYDKYRDWKIIYDELNARMHQLESEIKYQTVAPRLLKLKELKDKYEKWAQYDKIQKIQAAYNMQMISEDISKYEKQMHYIALKDKLPLIKQKCKILDKLKNIESKISEAREQITEYNVKLQQNNIYKIASEMLSVALQDINNTIELIDIVVTKFKDYKKYLYESCILKKLTLAANNHIKSLCHMKTKCFEIGYLVTESNGNIHINWLVKTDDDNKQTISVKQASGFQQFAISLALRMSLFGNKQCQQLFIDEGFTACDKQNLSIVPSFLKGLLKTFHTVIIVSHIDIIQDSIDNVAYIHYDKSTNNSKMAYGDIK
jgi:DNA repair exonuclease SbcCD ATPase subunit/DNA repair exonuclease SbcCD nuclease subunit